MTKAKSKRVVSKTMASKRKRPPKQLRKATTETFIVDVVEEPVPGVVVVDVAMNSFGTFSKGFQAIGAEIKDYSKKSFEEGTAALEKLLGTKSLDQAIVVQTDYLKSAYEGFVSQATKLGELYSNLAKHSYKPFGTFVAKAPAK